MKWMCVNRPDDVVKLSFGSSNQLRTSVVGLGPSLCYFVDMPRTGGKDDAMNSFLSTIEDIKNGHVASSMYGLSCLVTKIVQEVY